WLALKQAASQCLYESGGTITHHHAVGQTHLPWYRKERPEGFGTALQAIKDAVDPSGVLNPRVLI
ncbi:MAG: hypothetical protein KC561_18120, partial [Myxococcales bacterium]|nr:hypothetical protein [Myxococcales bacterium]